MAETVQTVKNVATWSEEAGYDGILVYTDNRLVDPWITSQAIIEVTEKLTPLIAVQPIYMHPYSVAKMIWTIAHLTGRKVFLNMLAGGFLNDLTSLGDQTPHDERYNRTVEYTQILSHLLRSSTPLTFDGKYYKTKNLKLNSPLPEDLQPGILLSGSSDSGLAASRKLGAVAVQYPEPPGDYKSPVSGDSIDYGIRIGVIARSSAEEAWSIAERRFPEDKKGQIAHNLSMKVSDSKWHETLSDIAERETGETYWLRPFKNYQTFCPYLVGEYSDVAEILKSYLDLGYSTFIMDVPAESADFEHTARAFELATKAAAG